MDLRQRVQLAPHLPLHCSLKQWGIHPRHDYHIVLVAREKQIASTPPCMSLCPWQEHWTGIPAFKEQGNGLSPLRLVFPEAQNASAVLQLSNKMTWGRTSATGGDWEQALIFTPGFETPCSTYDSLLLVSMPTAHFLCRLHPTALPAHSPGRLPSQPMVMWSLSLQTLGLDTDWPAHRLPLQNHAE